MKNSTIKEETMTTEIAVIDKLSIQNVTEDAFAHFEDAHFEDSSVEFFKPSNEFLNVQLNVIMTHVEEFDMIDEVTKQKELRTFVKGYVQTETGYKKFYFGQAKIVNTFQRVDKGTGILAKLTFKGLIKIKGNRTMNEFEMLTAVMSNYNV